MNVSRKFAGTTLLMAAAKALNLLPSVLLIPVYTRFVDPTGYGQADLVLNWLGLAAPIVLLRADMAALRLLIDARGDREATTRIVSTGLAIAGIGSGVGVIVFFVLASQFSFGFVPVATVALIVTASATLLGQIVRGIGRNTDYVVAAGLGGIALLATGTVAVTVFHLGGTGILLAWAASQLVSTSWMAIRCKLWALTSPDRIDWPTARRLLTFGLPLVPEGILWWVMQVSDRTVITAVLGLSATGVYSLASRFAGIVNGGVSVLWMSWTQVSVEITNHDTRSSEYSTILDKYYIRALGSGCAILLLATSVTFNTLVGPEFAAAYPLIPGLIFAGFLSGILGFFAGLFSAAQTTGRLAISDIAPTIVNLTLTFALLKPLGIQAAVIASIASYALTIAIRAHMIRPQITLRPPPPHVLTLLTTELAAAAAFYYTHNAPLKITTASVTILIALLLNTTPLAVWRRHS